jgi:hypothetical protein
MRSSTSFARVEWLEVGGSVERWRRIGVRVADDGMVPFMFTSLRIVEAEPAVRGWAISGIDPSVTHIDGLSTSVIEAGSPQLAEHPNGGVELDHVVVLTDSLERTCAAIEAATGAPLKRVREVGAMRQGFHRVGSGGLIVEVVERPEVDVSRAVFWGLVVNVDDLDAAVAMLGPDLVGPAKDAVQPGRRIATVRPEAGLGVPVAFMSLR